MAAPLKSAPHASGGPEVEIVDLRHFTSADLRPLLEKEAQRWWQELSWDYRGSAEMILRYLDAKILPGYAAVAQERVCGYSFFVYEGSKGVVGDLYVDTGGRPPSAVAELEERLLMHVLETLENSPGIHRIEAQLLLHEAGARAAPFVREGFRRYRRLFMLWPLGDAGQVAVKMPAGIELRRWSEADFSAGAAVITAAYRDHIDSEINDQYRTTNGSMRFLNNIVRFPGCGVFDADASLVAIHQPLNAMVGLILCSRVKDDVGHVTQVCVTPELRGLGIGEALVGASARELQRRQFTSLSLTVTEANSRAVELYKRLGFKAVRAFDAFVWEG